MVVGDPALVVALAVAAASGAGRLGAGEGLGLGGGGLARGGGLLAAVGLGRARLREQGLDPRLVDEVQGRAEDAGQEEVEEDA